MKHLVLPIIALLFIAALSAQALPPPEGTQLTIAELQEKPSEFDGKIVEVSATFCENFSKSRSGEQTISCIHYHSAGPPDRIKVYIPGDNEDALEFFIELSEKNPGAVLTSFFVMVDGKKITAVGEKFNKSKGSYKW